VQQPGDGPQPVVARFGQVQRLLGRLPQLVEQHPEQPASRAAVEDAGRGVVVARAGEREQRFASEVGEDEDGAVGRRGAGERRGQEHDPHLRRPVRAVVVRHAGRDPCDPVGRDDPRPGLDVHGEHAAGGVEQVPAVVRMHVAGRAGRPLVQAAGRPESGRDRRGRRVAGFGHRLAFCRYRAAAALATVIA